MKRAGLVLTMSSTADRENLQEVSTCCREHGRVGWNSDLGQNAAITEEREKALDAAVAALGLAA